jgi:signal transduction histidine kinase/ActR/RegA family two-component response regulator
MTPAGAEPTAPASAPPPALVDQIGVEQVSELFRNVTLGVVAASVGAAVLGATLYRLGYAEALSALGWTGFIILCALAHIALRRRYDRARRRSAHWRFWAVAFTMISLAEGIGWGWGTLGLASGGGLEVLLLVLVVTLATAAGAASIFSPYLPAFLALLLPATLPYLIASLGAADPLQVASVLLMLVFICGIGGLGITMNRSFKALVGLRLHAEQMARELGRQKEIAEQASLAKSSFLAAASHDLRQPIHALGLFAGALKGVAMSAEGQRMVEHIEASAEAMDGLFSVLLDISRLDAGIVEVHRRAFAIGPFMARLCRDHEQEARAKGLSLICVPSAAVVDSDPLLIERILRNLISNAVRHTQAGGVVVGCRRRGAGHVAVQIWDSGPGIPAEQSERIFQEYYQLGNPERDRTKGLGLGLAIVRRLTQLVGCPLSFRSRQGRGSCFQVTLPLAGADAGDEPSAEKAAFGALATGLVIVIDDEAAIREAMATLLGGWGFEVVSAGSGDDAIGRLATCPARPDLIISDYRLRDGETGAEVIDRLRFEYNEAIPAMLITGDTAPDRLVEAQASGLLLLHKPVSNGRLRAAIVNLVGASRSEASEDQQPYSVR